MSDCLIRSAPGIHIGVRTADGSSDAAVRNGGSGILTRFSNGKTLSMSLAACELSSDRFVGLVVKASASRSEDPGFKPRLAL